MRTENVQIKKFIRSNSLKCLRKIEITSRHPIEKTSVQFARFLKFPKATNGKKSKTFIQAFELISFSISDLILKEF